MSGEVIVTICPAYDGSVSTSWYPVMLVLNTTSPRAMPWAPAAVPRYTVPFSNARTASMNLFSLQRRRHSHLLTRAHAHRGRPRFIAIHLDAYGCGPRGQVGNDERRRACLPIVDEHARSRRS